MNSEPTASESNAQYNKLVGRAARLAVAASFVLVAIKIVAWLITDSISLFASLADSTLDISASLANLFIIRFALQPADKEHNFGHGKLEALAALMQVVIIVASALFVVSSAVSRLYNHIEPQYTSVGLVIMLISSAITGALVYYQHMVVKQTQSQAIKADAMHYKSDLLVNLGVIAALIATYFALSWADALVALLITGVMLFSAKSIAVEAIDTLMDKSLPNEELTEIQRVIKQHPQVIGMHDLCSRKAGKTRFIQLHLELPDKMTLYQAHDIAERIEEELGKKLQGAHILIHLDPASIVGKEHHNRLEN